jgi:hypothetical protein
VQRASLEPRCSLREAIEICCWCIASSALCKADGDAKRSSIFSDIPPRIRANVRAKIVSRTLSELLRATEAISHTFFQKLASGTVRAAARKGHP